ncbi:hypothetical protein [Microvirga mediterraneensis]|jgi:hypothetical protein|uniref:Uncharacterized protein n=1 Tax=Microvirga mediterraneensis TaxID=2754695 RepID=A0A838BM38_9HYPH|nr:hypothetical protein [Microvirga mediterraneensis]MBA1155872.1 hypothetical protein [Microvirga mediterraneensis]
MTQELRHKYFDRSMSEWIKMVANELPIDAVGMWQIVPGGRHGFGLEGEALTDYVRRCIAELLSRGAVPVVGGGLEGEHEWIAQPQYGSKPDEIIENVVREWLANGAKDEDPGGLWFARRERAWFPPA